MGTVPAGIDSDHHPALTEEAKRAIDAYLGRYVRKVLSALSVLGVATLLGGAASLLYIFFRLPDEAADKAFSAWNVRFSRHEERIESSLAKAIELETTAKMSMAQVAALAQKLPELRTRMEGLEKSTESLEQSVGRLSASDLARAAEIAASLDAEQAIEATRAAKEALQGAEEVKRNLAKISERLDEVEGTLQVQVMAVHDIELQMEPGKPAERDATGSPVTKQ